MPMRAYWFFPSTNANASISYGLDDKYRSAKDLEKQQAASDNRSCWQTSVSKVSVLVHKKPLQRGLENTYKAYINIIHKTYKY